jgi:hypothetical protein
MKNLIFFTLFLVFVACRNSVEIKDATCQQYEKGSYEYKQDSLRKGLDFVLPMSRGNLYKAVEMNDYDTIYRYHGTGGWGEFDYICSIYKQMDTPQYKVQLLKQNIKYDTMYQVSEKSLSVYEWQYCKEKFSKSNFWCYGISKEGFASDPNHYSLIAKEKDKKRRVFWQEEQHYYDTLRGVGMEMLELANYPLPYASIFCKKERDSISVEVIPFMNDYNLVKNYEVKTNLKGGKKHDGVYFLRIHRKDFAQLNDIELVTEFYNGKIRTTTEKKIEKNF